MYTEMKTKYEIQALLTKAIIGRDHIVKLGRVPTVADDDSVRTLMYVLNIPADEFTELLESAVDCYGCGEPVLAYLSHVSLDDEILCEQCKIAEDPLVAINESLGQGPQEKPEVDDNVRIRRRHLEILLMVKEDWMLGQSAGIFMDVLDSFTDHCDCANDSRGDVHDGEKCPLRGHPFWAELAQIENDASRILPSQDRRRELYQVAALRFFSNVSGTSAV